jgi:NAD-dependent SIR2 family protein deacetylase
LGTAGDDGNETAKPTRAKPSDSHKLLALLEEKKMLLRVYSQNIDGMWSLTEKFNFTTSFLSSHFIFE